MRANNASYSLPYVSKLEELNTEDPNLLLIKVLNLKIERLELENRILKNKVQEILLKRDLSLLGQN